MLFHYQIYLTQEPVADVPRGPKFLSVAMGGGSG